MNAKHQLVFALLGMVAVPASAQQNLLPQGDFNNPSVTTEWAEGFNIPKNREFQVVSENGKHWLRIENHDANRQLDYVHAYVKVAPRITSLTVAVRMRARNLSIGKEGWHTARVALMFEGGSFGYPALVPELRADSDWVTKSVELKVPAGATRLNIQPAMFYCTGVFEIADLTVAPRLAGTTKPPADAELPAGMSLNWEQTKIVRENTRRARISLDGIWRFAPAGEGSTGPPGVGWGWIRVPGNWQRSPGRSAGFLVPGAGPQWDLYDGTRVARAWYQRRIPIPAEWKGRAISVRFERVCADAIVYINGTECGRVAWPWGSVDVTSAVTPGQTAELRVLVAAIADPEQVGTFWQNAFMNVSYAAASLRSRGLTGGVILESRTSKARVSDLFVRTSTRKKEIAIDVDLTGVKQAGPVQVVADMLDEKGNLEKSFKASAEWLPRRRRPWCSHGPGPTRGSGMWASPISTPFG